MPATLSPRLSLAGLSKCMFFLAGMWTVLMLYLLSNLLILFETERW